MKKRSFLVVMGLVMGAASVASAAPQKSGYRDPAVRRVFNRYDADQNGKIGVFEYRRAVSRRFARWMSRVDRDRDGYLTKPEIAYAARTAPVAWPELTRAARSGRWGRKAFRPIPIWRLWASHMEQARRDFTRVDRDNNRWLSRQEFRRGVRRGTIRVPRAAKTGNRRRKDVGPWAFEVR